MAKIYAPYIFKGNELFCSLKKKKKEKREREREGETELSDKATSLLCLDQLEAHMKAFSKFKMNVK